MDEARKELERIIQDREMKDALLLVFANKQDVRGCEYLPLRSAPRPGCAFVEWRVCIWRGRADDCAQRYRRRRSPMS